MNRPTSSTQRNQERYSEKLRSLYPTLSQAICERTRSLAQEKISPFNKEEINDNSWIVSNDIIRASKTELLKELELLKNDITHQPIILFIDDCFTNKELILLLKSILWPSNFRRFVRIIPMDFAQPAKKFYWEKTPFKNHSLYILGGSLADVDTIHPSFYTSQLASEIKDVSDEFPGSGGKNNKMLGICFWQQFIANIIGTTQPHVQNIITTVKWHPQFGPSTCRFEDLSYIPDIYQQAIAGLTNFGQNSAFSTLFTRMGYVEFNLLKSGLDLGIIPLIRDNTSQGIVGWWSKNGSILGMQFHPELSILNQTSFRSALSDVIEQVYTDPDERNQCVSSFERATKLVHQDISEPLYVFTLLAFIRDIRLTRERNLQALSRMDPSPSDRLEEVHHDNVLDRLRKVISSRVGANLLPDHSDGQKQLIDSIDLQNRLRLNSRIDWKVGRTLSEISTLSGVNFETLIPAHKHTQNQPYIIRDLWAGDGTTMKEVECLFAPKNQPHDWVNPSPSENDSTPPIVYGAGDYVYLDLFRALKKSSFCIKIPEELLILFVEKVADHYQILTSWRTIDRIRQSIKACSFAPTDKIRHSSMTADKTSMFAGVGTPLSPETQASLKIMLPVLESFKEYVSDHIYSFFTGPYWQMYISKFSDLQIEDPIIGKIDFQYAIRSTSHVGGREYISILLDFLNHHAKHWAIFVDNGVLQSYTAILRLPELLEVRENTRAKTMSLVYNPEHNTFSSVIIIKGEEFPLSLEPHILKSHSIVSLEEAAESTFFQIENFIRNFLVINFKSHDIFSEFSNQINQTLDRIMQNILSKNMQQVPGGVLDLVNHIATHGKNKIPYNTIEIEPLKHYTINKESLENIVNRPVFTPDWINPEAKREY